MNDRNDQYSEISGSHLKLTLRRSPQVKRYPIIAKITLQRERQDLVDILNTMSSDSNSMPARLKHYLELEGLWKTNDLTPKGQQVINSGLYETNERGLYHIWYIDNDPLLATYPLLMQRDDAFSNPDKKVWLKGSDAAYSDFGVQGDEYLHIDILEEIFIDRHKSELKHHRLPLLSLEPEVVCSAEKSADISMVWTLETSYSSVKLNGRLDMLGYKKKKDKDKPEPLDISIPLSELGSDMDNIMRHIAEQLNGWWDDEQCRLAIRLEQLKDKPASVQQFQLKSFTRSLFETENYGIFNSVEALHIPLKPNDLSDAEAWHLFWLEYFYDKDYRTSSEARQRQSDWLNHPALNDFDLPLKEGDTLLQELSREGQPEAYWHVAAMVDLTPNKMTLPVQRGC